MKLLRALGLIVFLLFTAYIALYVFVWVALIAVIVVPVLYLYWRHRLRKAWKQSNGQPSAFFQRVVRWKE